MSHYSLVVIIRPEDAVSGAAVEAAIDRLMAPFNAYLEVEPYETDCSCHIWTESHLPDPACDVCHGEGRWLTKASPHGKYDWYQRGGRFTGFLVTDYDPETDPANLETCSCCSEGRPDPACLECEGTGIAVKWPTQWRRFDRDVLAVEQIRPDFVPFAVLTPNGKWKAEDNFAEQAEWEREYRAIMTTYRGSIAVMIDYHM